MGLIPSKSTIELTAKLTAYGKHKLYNSIEGGTTDEFIDSFALGDSDANYAAMENGTDTLQSGHVPDSSAVRSIPRSYALYDGIYRPGKPLVLIDGDDDQVYVDFAIGANNPTTLIYQITTEWPVESEFIEKYWMELYGGDSFTTEDWRRIFSAQMITNEFGQELRVSFTGNISLSDIGRLSGMSNDQETDFHINMTGQQSFKHTKIWFRITS